VTTQLFKVQSQSQFRTATYPSATASCSSRSSPSW